MSGQTFVSRACSSSNSVLLLTADGKTDVYHFQGSFRKFAAMNFGLALHASAALAMRSFTRRHDGHFYLDDQATPFQPISRY